MKNILLSILLILITTACSSDRDKWLFAEDSLVGLKETEIDIPLSNLVELKEDSIDYDSRSWDVSETDQLRTIYLYAQNQILSLTVDKKNGAHRVRFTLIGDKAGNISAKVNGKQIALGRGGSAYNAYLITAKDNLVNLPASSESTQGGKVIHQPYGDLLFKSSVMQFSYSKETFSIVYNNKTYSKSKAGNAFKSGNEALAITMNRLTTKIRAGLIVTDYILGLPSWEFKDIVGSSYKEWSFRVLLGDVPTAYYPLFNTTSNSEGTAVAVTQNKIQFEKAQGKGSWGEHRFGIGKVLGATEKGINAFVFPYANSNARLCYTFYHNGGVKNTLAIPIKHLGLTTGLAMNEEYDITVVIHVNDFKNFINKKANKSSRADEHIDPVFGRIVDIPYEVIVNKK